MMESKVSSILEATIEDIHLARTGLGNLPAVS